MDAEEIKSDMENLEISDSGDFPAQNNTPLDDVQIQTIPEIPGDDWLNLNVGGKLFSTTRQTLCSQPDSMLCRMFSQEFLKSSKMRDGAYLLDRSPIYFEIILSYLRTGQLIYDHNVNVLGILTEARYYGLESLVNELESMVSINVADPPLTRQDVIKALIQTSHKTELRFQGVNLSGADLRKLDLRNINFKYACLARCNLSYANLTNSNLERADLSHANLEGAQLVAIKGLCANMEGANLQLCNFEDPSGIRSNLEGVNLKGACLEGSNMTNVNLRVSNLKGANLKNCILRAAVLAGADLERCNLSGSDLQEANLRGANFKDADMELMLTPLHMSLLVCNR